MSPSTRSGKTYSEASSVTSSRRSSTTRSVHEGKRQPRSIARKDGDPLEAGQINPTFESQLKPSSVEGNKPNVETNLAEAVRLTRQEKDPIDDSQEIAGENRRKTIGTIPADESTGKSNPNPAIIREGQEETSYSGGHTNVNLVETTNADHFRSTGRHPSHSTELPSGIEGPQDRPEPTVGLDGYRPTGGSRPERRSGSFNGYRTNESVCSSDDSLDIFNQTLTTDNFRAKRGRRPSLQNLPPAVSHVQNGEESKPARRRNESADRVPALVPQHIQETDLAVCSLHQQRMESIQGGQIGQITSEVGRTSAADGKRVSTLRELHLLQQPTREKASRDRPQQDRQDTEARHLLARNNGGSQSLTASQSSDIRRVTQGGGSLQAPQERLDLQLVHTTLASLHTTLIDEIHARFVNFDEKLDILYSNPIFL
ncbi:hypothetical protein PGTUg99_032376 [Puccinia graminis f. sp. tritici]|uniref:Uncharacterized protein n=1 Tax=Puccinia graminis f. sp. tritici TaxID=56615 RepID=A0A5B0S1W8_PUCGR|nr:hypothetical protein PGTUg99_032376 [Puccinia graminis f. sp. tritici]